MTYVRPKKSLGQHFLNDHNIARKIVEGLDLSLCKNILEIGPGTGVLSRYLLEIPDIDFRLIEVDRESVEYLQKNFSIAPEKLIYGDFLDIEIEKLFVENFSIIGNFPYNISSQIFFKVLAHRNQIPQVVCMIQKEVAERIAAPPGSKTYGILSVLLQAFYNVQYLFTVNENVFIPPPKVKSAVISFTLNSRINLGCDEILFFKTVKTAFNQRRKTLRNSLSTLYLKEKMTDAFFDKRPEQLSVDDYVYICNLMNNKIKEF